MYFSVSGKILTLCNECGITNSTKQSLPLKNIKIKDRVRDNIYTDTKKYQSLIGMLLYIARMARPDICTYVQFLSMYNNKPYQYHYDMALEVVQYLFNTRRYCLYYKKDCKNILDCYAVTSFATNIADSSSNNGIIIYYNGNPIHWNTCNQKIIAGCTNEAELEAVHYLNKIVKGIINLKNSLGIQVNEINYYTDNSGVISYSKNGPSNKTKYYNLYYNIFRKDINSNLFKLNKVKSADNPADLFTKFCNKNIFYNLINKINREKLENTISQLNNTIRFLNIYN